MKKYKNEDILATIQSLKEEDGNLTVKFNQKVSYMGEDFITTQVYTEKANIGSMFTTIDVVRGENGEVFFDFPQEKELVIGKDNIADYYEFMGDEDKIKNKSLFHDLLTQRFYATTKSLNLKINWEKDDFVEFVVARKPDYIVKIYALDESDSSNVIGQSFFGIKDTLKPIDEYIKEIKESEGYKKYLGERQGVEVGNNTTFKIGDVIKLKEDIVGHDRLVISSINQELGRYIVRGMPNNIGWAISIANSDKFEKRPAVEQYMISEMTTEEHNEDSYTVKFKTFDDGEMLLDVDFSSADCVDISEQTIISSQYAEEFVTHFKEMTNLVDFLKENSTNYINLNPLTQEERGVLESLAAQADMNRDLSLS